MEFLIVTPHPLILVTTQTPDPRCQWMGIKAKSSGNKIPLSFTSCLSWKGKILPGISVKTSRKDVLIKINTRTYQPHLLTPCNNKQTKIVAFNYILLCWPFYFNSKVFGFQPQVGIELEDSIEFEGSDHKCPNFEEFRAAVDPKPAGVWTREEHISRNSTPDNELKHLCPLFLWYFRLSCGALLILSVIKQI